MSAEVRGKVRCPDVVPCGWCGSEIAVGARGRVPRWCGPGCRHRAWEQRRAAASGLVAREVVERVVTVEVPTPRAVRELPPATHSAVPVAPTGPGWAGLLREFAHQLDTGRIYTRDLPAITVAFDAALAAITRRLRS